MNSKNLRSVIMMRKISYVLLALLVLCAISSTAFAATTLDPAKQYLWIKGERTVAIVHELTAAELDMINKLKSGELKEGTIVVTKVLQSGDANDDNVIDGPDLNIWAGNYGANSGAGLLADFNGDGTVDGVDLNIWAGNYGGVGEPCPGGCVPPCKYEVK